MLVNTEGIVLKQRKIANNRRMITVFTKNYGKLSCGTSLSEKGKGKAALALRPFTYAEYDIYKGRDYYNINSAQTKKSYYSIGEDLERFLVASNFIEYLEKMLEDEQPKPKLFDMTLEFLDVISRANTNYETIFCAFIVKTLSVLGIMPELRSCVNCGKKTDDFGYQMTNGKLGHLFSVTAGGVVCPDCAEREKTAGVALICKPSFDIIEVLLYLKNNPLERFEKVGLKEEVLVDIKRILGKYVNYYLEIDIWQEEVEWK